MKQQIFEDQNRADWEAFSALLDVLEKKKDARLASDARFTERNFPQAYRRLCLHLAIAKDRKYSPGLVGFLHHLVMRGHQRLYQSGSIGLWRVLEFFLVEFPAAVRREARLVWLATLLLYGPAILLGMITYYDSETIYRVLPIEQVARFELMYDPDNDRIGTERQSQTDFMMLGHYIQNNISIGFRTFAGGLLFGALTVFALVFNGIYFGVASGYLTQLGYGETFWSFVCGHGAFELTGIVLSGTAGLMLARALFAPGRSSRMHALQRAGKEAIVLMIGVFCLLLIAAFVEAFWSSSSSLSPTLKYTAAVLCWSGVTGYFLFMGRARATG